MMLHLASFLTGFWTLWLLVGGPLAVRKARRWGRIDYIPRGVVAAEAAKALFFWPAWLWSKPV